MKGRSYDNRWATVVRTRTPTMVANPVQPGITPRAICSWVFDAGRL